MHKAGLVRSKTAENEAIPFPLPKVGLLYAPRYSYYMIKRYFPHKYITHFLIVRYWTPFHSARIQSNDYGRKAVTRRESV